jgi:hypothetical protein
MLLEMRNGRFVANANLEWCEGKSGKFWSYYLSCHLHQLRGTTKHFIRCSWSQAKFWPRISRMWITHITADPSRSMKQVLFARVEVLMAVKMSMLLFWVVTPCGIVGRYQRFGWTCCLHLQPSSVIFRTEDGDSVFLRNFGIYLRVHTASQPKSKTST